MPKVASSKRSERKAAASKDGESEVKKAAGASEPKRITWRNCCFTINNPRKLADGTFEPLCASLPEKCSYIVWSLEKGENGTPHYQGYLELIKPVESKDAGPIKKILGYPSAHVEKPEVPLDKQQITARSWMRLMWMVHGSLERSATLVRARPEDS